MVNGKTNKCAKMAELVNGKLVNDKTGRCGKMLKPHGPGICARGENGKAAKRAKMASG